MNIVGQSSGFGARTAGGTTTARLASTRTATMATCGRLDVPTSSHVKSDETYVGPRAFSEPETQTVRDLVGCERFAGVITYHSYSQLILYPWG